eukprot:CAMPEP_0173080326 /NCGR_PEP_ID=MMETSP1102-20130122/16206_1 /TAXON_ID=49646 /ORGANISM="Geminigera sp., Strain Caron Lab Isolate" /LENGTH=419 /DNA_ID=CAMNT_0013953885 /DNA_START=136 /DNA_END=1398 /DNA_ORIENTATION=+
MSSAKPHDLARPERGGAEDRNRNGKRPRPSTQDGHDETRKRPRTSFEMYLDTLSRKDSDKILGKRNYFFSNLSMSTRQKIEMDQEASYSVTQMDLAEETSKEILSRLKERGWSDPQTATITDATACIGGNTFSFAHYFANVNAVELDETRAKMLTNNVELLCEKNNVTVIKGDYNEEQKTLTQDVVFFDPPWGGESYMKQSSISLELSGKPLVEICRDLRGRTKFIVLKVPKNFDLQKFEERGKEGGVLKEISAKDICDLKGQIKFLLMIMDVAPAQDDVAPAQEDAEPSTLSIELFMGEGMPTPKLICLTNIKYIASSSIAARLKEHHTGHMVDGADVKLTVDGYTRENLPAAVVSTDLHFELTAGQDQVSSRYKYETFAKHLHERKKMATVAVGGGSALKLYISSSANFSLKLHLDE